MLCAVLNYFSKKSITFTIRNAESMKRGNAMYKKYINYISDIFRNFNINFSNYLAYYINIVYNNSNKSAQKTKGGIIVLKKILTAVLCTFILLCTVAFAAAELKAGDTAYVVYGGTVNVTKNATYSGGIAEISKGTRVTVLEPYVIGEDNRKFHKIQLSDGSIGYILAYTTARETTPILEAGETAEKELNKQCAN